MLENNFFANPQKVNVIQQKIIHQKSGLPKIEITNKEVKFSWQEIHALQKYFALREVLDVFQRAYQIPSPEQQAFLLREIREPWRQNVAFTISKKHSEMEEGKQILQQLQKTVKNFWNDKL